MIAEKAKPCRIGTHLDIFFAQRTRDPPERFPVFLHVRRLMRGVALRTHHARVRVVLTQTHRASSVIGFSLGTMSLRQMG